MGKTIRVLLIADSEAQWPALCEEFARGDYEPNMERIATASELNAALKAPDWDVILADDSLQQYSPAAALAALRESGFDIPLILLSNAVEPHQLRTALSLGAHDVVRYQNLVRLAPAVQREIGAARVRAARALTEAALREAEANNRKLVEQIPVGIHRMALDADTSTISISPQLERILGYPHTEWLADPDWWRQQIHPEDRERVRSAIASVYAPGAKPSLIEYRMLARDGSIVWFHDEIMLVRDQSGQPQYLQSVKMNITERKQAEAEAQAVEQRLAEWVAELEQTNRQLALLEQLHTQLQGCVSLDEALPIIGDFLPLLFPLESGALYLSGATPDQMEKVAAWGRAQPVEPSLAIESCWALRRGRLYVAELPHGGPACQHVNASEGLSYLCTPLTAQGETLGLLHICLVRDATPAAEDGARPTLGENKQRLATSTAERLAFTISNLKLQAALRARLENGADALTQGSEPAQIVVGPLTLNLETFELTVEGRLVKQPTPVEFELLQFLMRNAGKVYTTEQLLQDVWKYPPGTGSQEVVRAHVRNLRAKLEPNPRAPIYLRTIGRFGYTISAEETRPEQA